MNIKDERLDTILNKLSAILDSAYLCAADEEEREYINNTENELYMYLNEKGLLSFKEASHE